VLLLLCLLFPSSEVILRVRHYRENEYRLASVNYSCNKSIVVAFDIKNRVPVNQIGVRVNSFQLSQALPVAFFTTVYHAFNAVTASLCAAEKSRIRLKLITFIDAVR
jgi:hypothetical protein